MFFKKQALIIKLASAQAGYEAYKKYSKYLENKLKKNNIDINQFIEYEFVVSNKLKGKK